MPDSPPSRRWPRRPPTRHGYQPVGDGMAIEGNTGQAGRIMSQPHAGQPGSANMTRGRAAATAAALTMTFGIAGASWVVAVRQMHGMDMGVATQLGSFASFVALWVAMMAAMMLPSAAPAALRTSQAGGWVRAVPLFVGSYLAVWTLVGVAVFLLYRPHGSLAAGGLVIAAGVDEVK